MDETTMKRPVDREHPGAHVPAGILRLVDEGLLRDCSWHNDAMPRFEGLRYTVRAGIVGAFCLWVDYAAARDREAGPEAPRYVVTVGEVAAYPGDRWHCVDDEETDEAYATLSHLAPRLFDLLTDDSGDPDWPTFARMMGVPAEVHGG